MVLSVKPVIDAGERARSAKALVNLIDWAVSAYAQSLPDAIRYRAVLVLMDDLGAAVAASTEPEVAAATPDRNAFLRRDGSECFRNRTRRG